MFRERYLGWADLQRQLDTWELAFPTLFRRIPIGTTPEGRVLEVLVVGPDPDRRRATAWVDGNMHAVELAGSCVALAIVEDLLAIHQGENPLGLSEPVLARLRDTLVFALPRMSPDGAEAVLETGRYVRSVPRDAREGPRPRWVAGDVDGDGQALLLRQRDAGGEFVVSTEVPGLMVLRGPDDPGPYYKIWPEGHVADWDGRHVPAPVFLSDHEPDLNRNFPYDWRPEGEQVGAGRYPTSEPESRAVVAFVEAHPEIFAWLNLHTFGGVFIRPCGDKPDNKMDPADLAIYRELAHYAETVTGYPTVSGFEEFLYEPEKPIRGDLVEYAYRQRGCLAQVCELWDLFHRLGWPRPARFVDRYVRFSRQDLENLARWDAAENGGRIVRPWVAVNHPQLGDVEVGGLDPRIGISNPPESHLAELCRQHAAVFLRMAALGPEVRLTLTVGDGVARVTVENLGYLGTEGIHSSKGLPWNDGLTLSWHGDGVEVIGPALHRLGHLDGWGRGRWDGTDALYYARSRGTEHRRVVEVPVRGTGALTVRVRGARIGAITAAAQVG